MALNDRFLKACRREEVDCTPVWFMRQAGRYMAEYRAIRAKHTLLEICAQPELAAEVTLQPVRAFAVDAAILFADILLPLMPMGIHLEFAKGEGPVIHNPIGSRADVEALRVIDPCEELRHVLDAVKLVRRELDGKTPLIGFAGAPFTLASYHDRRRIIAQLRQDQAIDVSRSADMASIDEQTRAGDCRLSRRADRRRRAGRPALR